MKMLLVVVPNESEVTDDMLGDLMRALEDQGLTSHEVDLPEEFDFLRRYVDPKNQVPMAYGMAHLALMPIAFNAFTDALEKDRNPS